MINLTFVVDLSHLFLVISAHKSGRFLLLFHVKSHPVNTVFGICEKWR